MTATGLELVPPADNRPLAVGRERPLATHTFDEPSRDVGEVHHPIDIDLKRVLRGSCGSRLHCYGNGPVLFRNESHGFLFSNVR